MRSQPFYPLYLYPMVFAVMVVSGLGLYSGSVLGAQALDNRLLAKAGDIIQVQLRELHPTQSAVGKLQIAGDLADYAQDRTSLFKDLCKVQGAGKLLSSSERSTPHDPSSYRCSLLPGSDKSAMNTIDIGPGGEFYLTDGHHAFNSFWDAVGGGGEVTLAVLVGENLTHDAEGNPLSHQQFEQKMAQLKHFLPIDAAGKPITFAQLPQTLGMAAFQDDPYRSILYYLRGVSYDKSDKNLNPNTGQPYSDVPFLEFYWGQLLNEKMDLSRYDLRQQDDYIRALNDAALVMVGLSDSQLIGSSGKTAAELGKLNKIHQKKLKKLAQHDSKLAKALAYQAAH
ncbi:Putative ParB-like nuclease [Pragia fontium]|uniref:ParB-like protein n=1 Tax=Pragia fontium TaxID=82985 RepID=UPI000E07C345|nr:ParB/Srx family N-terminal domain-containing protein [Pragia fontium]SUB83933.1 Putative ParB-like nuclease [Pragia fontium]